MNTKAKPFIKWVGGKGQLIEQLEAKLPADFDNWKNATYIEPFVGGGAMLFYMLQQHPNIRRAVINDINSDLITCYRVVRDNVEELIPALQDIQAEYYALQDYQYRASRHRCKKRAAQDGGGFPQIARAQSLRRKTAGTHSQKRKIPI